MIHAKNENSNDRAPNIKSNEQFQREKKNEMYDENVKPKDSVSAVAQPRN